MINQLIVVEISIPWKCTHTVASYIYSSVWQRSHICEALFWFMTLAVLMCFTGNIGLRIIQAIFMFHWHLLLPLLLLLFSVCCSQWLRYSIHSFAEHDSGWMQNCSVLQTWEQLIQMIVDLHFVFCKFFLHIWLRSVCLCCGYFFHLFVGCMIVSTSVTVTLAWTESLPKGSVENDHMHICHNAYNLTVT